MKRDAKKVADSKNRVSIQAGRIAVLGTVWVELNDRGELVRLLLPGLDSRQPQVPARTAPLDPTLRNALERYVAGSPVGLQRLKLAPPSSPFAGEVRRMLCKIPWGNVLSYGEIARRIGKPGAARAVGRACATNPLPVVVPCHRVVAGSGPGGFGLGYDAKRLLLSLEGVNLDALVPGKTTPDS